MWLLGHPSLLVPLTLAVLYTEPIAPFFAFSPVFTGPLRTLVVLVFVLLHIGFGVFLSIGIFPYVSILAWSVFLPSWFWERQWVRRWTGFLGVAGESTEQPDNQPASPRSRRSFFARAAASTLVLAAFYFVLVWNMRQSNADPAEPAEPTLVQANGRADDAAGHRQ